MEGLDAALARLLAQGTPAKPDLQGAAWMGRRDVLLNILVVFADSFTVEVRRADGVEVYVQVARKGEQLLAETVSNEYLSESGALSPEQVNALLELGWCPPSDDERPNFHRYTGSDLDSLSRLATVLAITLRDCYGVQPDDHWQLIPADLLELVEGRPSPRRERAEETSVGDSRQSSYEEFVADETDHRQRRVAEILTKLPAGWREIVLYRQFGEPAWRIQASPTAAYAVRNGEFVWCEHSNDPALMHSLLNAIVPWRALYGLQSDGFNLMRLLITGPIESGRLGADRHRLPIESGDEDLSVRDIVTLLTSRLGASDPDDLGLAVFSLIDLEASSTPLLELIELLVDQRLEIAQRREEEERRDIAEAPAREAEMGRRQAAERARQRADERARLAARVGAEDIVEAAAAAASSSSLAEWGEAVLQAIDGLLGSRLGFHVHGHVNTLRFAAGMQTRSFDPFEGYLEGAPAADVQGVVSRHEDRLRDLAAVNAAVARDLLADLAQVVAGAVTPPMRWVDLEERGASRERPQNSDDGNS